MHQFEVPFSNASIEGEVLYFDSVAVSLLTRQGHHLWKVNEERMIWLKPASGCVIQLPNEVNVDPPTFFVSDFDFIDRLCGELAAAAKSLTAGS